MNYCERQHRTKCKLHHRANMMKNLGLHSGTIYDIHRKKIQSSLGYMRDGNVSHYVQCGFGKRTKNSSKRRSYGPKYNYSKHDMIELLKGIDE